MTFKRLASRVVGFLLLAGIGTWGSPALAAPTLWLYYALGSADPADPIPIMTLIEGGTLTAATGETLWRPYQLDALPASALRRGQALQSTAPLGLISGAEHSIALVPDAWEGALFVSPHHRGRQFYSLMSPHADTAAEIAIADRHYVVRLPEGVAVDFDAGLEEGATAVLRAGEPIRVARWSVDGGRRAGPEPVPPAGTERWGWFDAPALIAAAENGTSLTLYTSRGERDERRLNAGEQLLLVPDPADTSARADAVFLAADKPVGAVRAGDSPMDSPSAWLGPAQLGTHFGLPEGGVRLAVACPRTTAVTLATPDKAPRSQVCLGSGGHPGVVEFRQTADDAAMPPGGYLESTYPVLAAVRRDGAEGPRALLGARAEPVPPLLEPQATAVPGRASVRGTTSPGADVRVWIDGTLADEVTAGPDGRFATALDTGAGARSIQATAHAHGRSSLPGNVVLVVPQLAGALSAPVLDAPVSPTNSNPYAVTGTAAANSTVRLYVNGTLSASTPSGADGRFSVPAALLDGSNSLYTALWDGGLESPPSNTIIIDYVNTLPRAQGGTINQNTVWTPGNGDPYVISSTLQVSVGATFTLQPGTKVKFNNGNGLQVDGTLVVRGTAAQPVTFTSGQAAPAAGNWPGIQINGAATNVTIDYAVVEYAAVGILFNDNARGAVGHSTVRSSTIGVRFNAGSGGTLAGSAVRNNWYGVQFYPASTGALTGNTIRDNAYYGVQVAAKATPRITGGNEITANNHGLYVAGDGVAANNPAPVVTGNSLYGNAGYNYYATSFGAPATTVLDATGNWWGSADPGAIAAKIYDYSDYPSGSPTVNFSGYLNGPGGNPVGGGNLQGVFNSSATLVAGVYTALGGLYVPSGVTLTLEAGATLRFPGNFGLTVDGTLVVRGTAAQPVTFTSGQAAPAAGNWPGIQINGAATNVTIDYAVVEYAAVGILFNDNARGAVGHSTVRSSTIGVRFNAGSGGTLAGSAVRNTQYGIQIATKATPRITGGNEITANNLGILVAGITGDGNAANNPAPVVTGNSLYGNAGYNYYATSFGAPATTVLDATGNWWGSADPGAIAAKIYDYNDNAISSPLVDFTGFLDGPNGNIALSLTGVTASAEQFNPLLDAPLTYRLHLPLPTAVELRIMKEGATDPVRRLTQRFTEAGNQTLTWDGRDDSGQFVTDGLYYPALTLSNGQQTYTFIPPPVGSGSGDGTVAPQYNVYRNEFFKINYAMGAPGLVRMRVTPQGENPFYPLEWKPYPSGTSLLMWDGRYTDGRLVEKPVDLFFDAPQLLRFGTVIVRGTTPTIRGAGAAPGIEVKADPYLVVHSYEQTARLAYQIDQDADVTVKMLPPGIADPADMKALTLISNQRQLALDGGNPRIHSVDWRGHATADTHAILAGENGAYTFTIEATSVTTRRTALYRGVLQLFR